MKKSSQHKIVRPGNVASDFFLYLNEKTGVVIDLFYAQDRFSLMGIINYKLKRYSPLPYEIYFVLVGNENITQVDIEKKLLNMKNPLPKNIFIDTEANFKSSTIYDLKKRSKYPRINAVG